MRILTVLVLAVVCFLMLTAFVPENIEARSVNIQPSGLEVASGPKQNVEDTQTNEGETEDVVSSDVNKQTIVQAEERAQDEVGNASVNEDFYNKLNLRENIYGKRLTPIEALDVTDLQEETYVTSFDFEQFLSEEYYASFDLKDGRYGTYIDSKDALKVAEMYNGFVWDGPKLVSEIGHEDGPFGYETGYPGVGSAIVDIMRECGYSEEEWPYEVREDGCKCLGGYVILAADPIIPRGMILPTTRGLGIVCDRGYAIVGKRLDLAVNWVDFLMSYNIDLNEWRAVEMAGTTLEEYLAQRAATEQATVEQQEQPVTEEVWVEEIEPEQPVTEEVLVEEIEPEQPVIEDVGGEEFIPQE